MPAETTATPWLLPTMYWVEGEDAPTNDDVNNESLQLARPMRLSTPPEFATIANSNSSSYKRIQDGKLQVKLGSFRPFDSTDTPSTLIDEGSTITGIEVIIFSRFRYQYDYNHLGSADRKRNMHKAYLHLDGTETLLGESMSGTHTGFAPYASRSTMDAYLDQYNNTTLQTNEWGDSYNNNLAYHPYMYENYYSPKPLSANNIWGPGSSLKGVSNLSYGPNAEMGISDEDVMRASAGTQIGSSLSFIDSPPNFDHTELTSAQLEELNNDMWLTLALGEHPDIYNAFTINITALYVKIHFIRKEWVIVPTVIPQVNARRRHFMPELYPDTSTAWYDYRTGLRRDKLVKVTGSTGAYNATSFISGTYSNRHSFSDGWHENGVWYAHDFSQIPLSAEGHPFIGENNPPPGTNWDGTFETSPLYQVNRTIVEELENLRDIGKIPAEHFANLFDYEYDINYTTSFPKLGASNLYIIEDDAEMYPHISFTELFNPVADTNTVNIIINRFEEDHTQFPYATQDPNREFKGFTYGDNVEIEYDLSVLDYSLPVLGISIPATNSGAEGCVEDWNNDLIFTDNEEMATLKQALLTDGPVTAESLDYVTPYPFVFERWHSGRGLCVSREPNAEGRPYWDTIFWEFNEDQVACEEAGYYFVRMGVQYKNSNMSTYIHQAHSPLGWYSESLKALFPFVAPNMYPNLPNDEYALGGDLLTNMQASIFNSTYSSRNLKLEFHHGDIISGSMLGLQTRVGWYSKYQTIPDSITVYQVMPVNRYTEEVADVRDFDSVDPDLPLSITAIGGVSYASLSLAGLGNKFLVMGSETAVGPPAEEPPVNVNDLYFLGTGHNADNVPTAPEAFDGATETQSTINAASGIWTVNGDGTHPKLSSGTTVVWSSWLNIYQWFGGPLGAFSGNQYIRTDPSLWGNDPLNEFMTPNVDINFFNILYPTHTAPASFVLSFKLSQNGNETGTQPGLLTIELMTVENGIHGSNDGNIPADSSVPLNFIVNGTAYTSLGTQINTNQNSSYTHSGRIETGFVDPETGSGDDIPGWTPVIVNIPDPPSMFRVKFTYLRRPAAPFWGTNIPPPNEAGTAVPIPHRPVVAFDNFSIKGSLVDSTDLGGGGEN